MSVKPPPHQRTRNPAGSFEEALEDLGGWFPDRDSAARYHTDVNSAYHSDRLRAIKKLGGQIAESDPSALNVVDFGIGDGKEISEIGLSLGHITGIDLSPEMISLAQASLDGFDCDFLVGGVEKLSDIDNDSADVVVSTNVLGYLPEDDEETFFREAARLLRPGGWVLLTLGNELFDLFALNSGTVSFFETHLGVVGTEELLTEGKTQRFANARRHNPLALEAQLTEFGLDKVAYSFSQWHTRPPVLEHVTGGKSIAESRLSVRNHDFDPNSLSARDNWKALLQCSLFGALFRKA